MENRRIDYGRIALILTVIILGIFVVDFCKRLWEDWNGTGKINIITSSSQTDSTPDSSGTDHENSENSGTDSSSDSGSETPNEPNPNVPTDYNIMQVSSSTVNTGSLILVDATHAMTGTPEVTAFQDFTYAHIRLPRRDLVISNTTIDPIVKMFAAYYAVAGVEDLMVYSTTTDPAVANYGLNIPERVTGLSIDLGLLNESGGYHVPYSADAAHLWVAQHASDYGYVERFPAGKESITGQQAMPWHYRYVGVPHATYMAENSLCLEEYLTLMQSHKWEDSHIKVNANGTEYEIYYVPVTTGSNITKIPYPIGTEPMISGDNMGGFVVACEPAAATQPEVSAT